MPLSYIVMIFHYIKSQLISFTDSFHNNMQRKKKKLNHNDEHPLENYVSSPQSSPHAFSDSPSSSKSTKNRVSKRLMCTKLSVFKDSHISTPHVQQPHNSQSFGSGDSHSNRINGMSKKNPSAILLDGVSHVYT